MTIVFCAIVLTYSFTFGSKEALIRSVKLPFCFINCKTAITGMQSIDESARHHPRASAQIGSTSSFSYFILSYFVKQRTKIEVVEIGVRYFQLMTK